MEMVKGIKNLGHIKLAVIVVGLAILDVVLTPIGINNGAHEINPIMCYFLEHLGWVAWVIKLTITTVGMLLLLWLQTRKIALH